MPPKSNSRKSKKEVQDDESANSNSNNSGSTKTTNNKHSRRRSGNLSTSTTIEPSSASATVASSIAEARGPTSPSAILPVATAAAAAAPIGKKQRRAGFRGQFLQKLRVMLDRESQNDDAIVHWSTGGNSFIVTDQTRFEEEIIPSYFGNPIVFTSFLRKLQRWGFVRVSSKRSRRCEFISPTFKRIDSRSAQAPAAVTDANTFGNDGGGASIQFPPQQQQQQQQQVLAQFNQQPMPVPYQLPRQPDASSAIADLISNIQRSTQQPFTSSSQPGPNQHTNQMNIADINSTLQNIIDKNQHQPIASQNPVLNQQPAPNHASQLNNVAGNDHLQWQHPNNPTMNLLNSALQSLTRGPTSPAQAMGQYHTPSAQSNAVHALMSLSGMLPQSPLITTPAATQSNNMEPLLLLLLALQQFVQEEHQRRVQVDALHHGIIMIIGHIVGQNNVINEADGQTFGRAGEINMHLRNPTGMTVRVPNNNNSQPNQAGERPPPSVDKNTQADSITASNSAPRGDAQAQPEEDAPAQNYGVATSGNEDGHDEGKVDEPFSPRYRRSSDNYEADNDDRDKRLRKRKKPPPK